MTTIYLEIISKDKQRYDTVGDWYWSEAVLRIVSARFSDPRYEYLVHLHELVEALLCSWAGVSQAKVDTFDREYEANRPFGNKDEPGDDPKAPYHHQHVIASVVERLAAVMLKVDWNAYAKEVEELWC